MQEKNVGGGRGRRWSGCPALEGEVVGREVGAIDTSVAPAHRSRGYNR